MIHDDPAVSEASPSEADCTGSSADLLQAIDRAKRLLMLVVLGRQVESADLIETALALKQHHVRLGGR